jgi:hypothetical protein
MSFTNLHSNHGASGNNEYHLSTLATDRKFDAQFSCYSSHYRLCDVIGNGGLHACLFSVNIWLNMATKQYTVIYTDALFAWADYFVIKLCVCVAYSIAKWRRKLKISRICCEHWWGVYTCQALYKCRKTQAVYFSRYLKV